MFDVKRVIISTLLIPGLLGLLLLPSIIDLLRGPSDDPSLLCQSADPSPLTEVSNADLVLQACAAGKTFTIRRGDTIAVDLTGSGGVDTSGTFHNLTVSDSSILSTVVAPKTIALNIRNGTRGRFFDYLSIYRAVRTGRATISALLNTCWNGGCNDTNRWRATVQVT